jgi:hypothetical protein
MAKQVRGGKRRAWKRIHPGGGGEPYHAEVIEVYGKIGGKKRGSHYSITKHGVAGANKLADAWLEEHRARAAQEEAEVKS